MSKILFIEDELTKNIASIIRFFSPILQTDVKQKLEQLNNENRIFPSDIVQVCQYQNDLDIAFTFPEALRLIVANHKLYDLIIIDRNLSEYQYNDELTILLKQLYEIFSEDWSERISKFHEREGDLLLLVLLKINQEYREKVYYLTANVTDNLRVSPEMQTVLNLGSFTKDHIIEKGSSRESIIYNILQDMDAFSIQNQYPNICGVLRGRLSEESVNEFIKAVRCYESNEEKEFMNKSRNILENILRDIALLFNRFDQPYVAENDKLPVYRFIKGDRKWNDQTKTSELVSGLPFYDNKYKIGYTAVIRNACLSIHEVASEYAAHYKDPSISNENRWMSNYSMNTLLNQLCDVISWYGDVIPYIKNFITQ